MRNLFLSATLFPAALALASCSAAQDGEISAESTPAPSGVMAGEAVSLEAGSPFTATSMGSFDSPWAIAFEPGTGRVFITEKGGTAKLFDPATGRTLAVAGMPQVAAQGQGGLGDIAFAPDYTTSGMVYLSWAQAAEGDTKRAVAARGRLVCDTDACRVEGLTEIWRQTLAVSTGGHYSHKFAFAPDGRHLFISSGDRQQGAPAQDNTNNLGTLVRLNLDGTPAQGNPFAAQGAPTNQIWSYGHRNALGLQFDAAGKLWDLEHGPRGGDELNLVEMGANYGWPERSNGDNYNGDPIPDHEPSDGFSQPAISWNPVIAPGDFVFYNGTMWPQWRGQAVIAGLGTTSIIRVATDAAGNSANEQARHVFPKRLRDIAQAPDGALWVIEDGGNGRLLRLTPAS
jgi:glucose/arabinose dehydrogenase